MPRAIRPLPFLLRLAALAAVLAAPLFATAARADFAYSVYAGTWSALPNFNSLSPVATGTSPVIDLSVTTRTANFGIQFTGTLTVPQAGTYLFSTRSDEGSDLRIDSTTVVNNDGLHTSREIEGTIALTAGTHSLRVRYFERTGAQALQVNYAPPGGGKRAIPANGVLEGPPDPRLVGSWGPVIAWPHVAITAAALADGRVLTWSSTETNAFPSSSELTRAAVYRPGRGHVPDRRQQLPRHVLRGRLDARGRPDRRGRRKSERHANDRVQSVHARPGRPSTT